MRSCSRAAAMTSASSCALARTSSSSKTLHRGRRVAAAMRIHDQTVWPGRHTRPARTATATASAPSLRAFHDVFAFGHMPLVLRARFAWAHD